MQQSSRVFFIRVFKGGLSSELVDQEEENANGYQQNTNLETSKPPTYFNTALKLSFAAILIVALERFSKDADMQILSTCKN